MGIRKDVSMELKNCRNCGKIIQYPGFGLQMCPQCIKNLDKKFKQVKEYLKKTPKASINELSEATDVTIVQINQWIREERLVFSKDSPIGIDCEGCGKMIKTGRYCPLCRSKLLNQLGGDRSKPAAIMNNKKGEDAKGRMRFLEH